MSEYVKRYGPFRGLNTKITKLIDKDGWFRDAKNVYVDQDTDDIISRCGFSTFSTSSIGRDGLFNYIKDSTIVSVGAYLSKLIAGSFYTTNYHTASTPFVPADIDGNADTAEVDGVIYIAKEGNKLSKYDGGGLMFAGTYRPFLNTSSFTIGAGGAFVAANYKFLFEYETTDFRGNIVLSGQSNTSVPQAVALNDKVAPLIRFGSSPVLSDGFNNHTAISNGAPTGGSIPITSSDLAVGDVIYVYTSFFGSDHQYRPFNVETVTATDITFTLPSYLQNNMATGDLLSAYIIRGYADSDASGGYLENYYPARFITASGTAAGINPSTMPVDITANPEAIEMYDTQTTENPYDFPAKARSLPPLAKSVEEWNGLLWCHGSFESEFNELGTPTFITEEFDYSIFHSNIDDGLLDSIENFNAVNNYKIGNEGDGKITTSKSNNGGLLVLKEKSLYTIAGDPYTRSLSIDKVEGSDIGCVAKSSVQDIMGEVFFLSDRGVYRYRLGSNLPTEVSDLIYDVFQDSTLDLVNAVSCHDTKRGLYLLSIPRSSSYTGSETSITLAYDYKRDGWWLWEGIDTQWGLLYFNGEIYYNYDWNTACVTAKENTLYKDQLTGAYSSMAIPITLEPSWETGNYPSISKKFNEVAVFSTPKRNIIQNTTTDPDFTMGLEVYKDWEYTTPVTDVDMTFSSAIPRSSNKIDGGKRQFKALGLKFTHSEIGKEFRLSGWELEVAEAYYHQRQFDSAKR